MKKRKQLQAWHFSAFFSSDRTIYVRKDASKEEVRDWLDRRYPGGNWDRGSLVKGKSYKVHPHREVEV